MKLIIQIPCLDEEAQLPVSLGALPRELPGFDAVEWLVIDDGSTDRTVEVARRHGVDHIVTLPQNRGLAAAFQAGLDAALKLGADVIVNTDADNQYDAAAIPGLVAPIVAGEADLVIGDRNVRGIEEFSFLKRRLQLLGSWVVRKASGTQVPDTTSGFRAYSREAALALTVVSPFTYTIESIIQAGKARAAIAHVPVATNPKIRESRLFGSTWGYIRRNAGVILRVFAAYEPVRFFGAIAALLLLASGVAFVPFLSDWLVHGDRSGHIQSIVVASVLAVAALQVVVLAILADMMRNQRVVAQRTLERVRRLELDLGVQPSNYEPGSPDTIPRRSPARAGSVDRRPASLAEALAAAPADVDAAGVLTPVGEGERGDRPG
ncbi:MAG: glycosyltransferase family 2 protein [Acidimicrobiales bacterium]|nr:glycosyltransferase family 2 protein [Acidimicrobiales bacterium]